MMMILPDLFSFTDSEAKPNACNRPGETLYTYTHQSIWYPLFLFLFGFFGLSVFSMLFSLVQPSAELSQAILFSQFLPYAATAFLIAAVSLAVPGSRRELLSTRFLNLEKMLIFSLVMIAVFFLANWIVSFISGLISGGAVNNNQSLIEAMFKESPWLMAIATVIFAPIVEEMSYRVGVCGIIKSSKKILQVVVSALVFGFLHFDFSAFGSLKDGGEQLIIELVNLPNYLCAGAVLAYVYVRSESIWPPIAIHAVNNLLSCLLMLQQLRVG